MLQKQPISLNFAQSVNTKADPFQLPIGQYQALTNAIFTKDGLLTKRNGFGNLIAAPAGAQTLATLNGGLVSLGNTCQSYNDDSGSFTNAGTFQPMELSTAPMVRRATGQKTVDIAVAPNGLACTTWLDYDGSSYYQIADSATGQVIIPAVALPNTAVMSRAYVLGNYFIVTFLITVSTSHLQYIAIPMSNPANPNTAADISSQAHTLAAAYDGQVSGNILYLALDCSDTTIRVWQLTPQLVLGTPAAITVAAATLLSVAVDTSNGPNNSIIWVSFFTGSIVRAFALNNNFTTNLAVTTVATPLDGAINEIVSTATNNVLTMLWEDSHSYSYTPSSPQASDTVSDTISLATITLAGSASGGGRIMHGIGIASRMVFVTSLNKPVVLGVYGQQFQPTYFLLGINSSNADVLGRLAYSNASGFAINQIIPNINQNEPGELQVGYLNADLVQAVNKTQGKSVAGIYTQQGINLATFSLGGQTSALEIGGGLHASGGMLWEYDGIRMVEHGFHIWPEDINATWSSSGGSMAAQPDGSTNTNAYFYQVTYEWTDGAGNIQRSAPSIPVAVTTLGTGSAGSVTLKIPNLRQTYKTGTNKVRIVIYRWSAGQQIYYQVTSVTNPTLNDPTTDNISFTDTSADANILGNNIIYTTGGVLENICAPGAVAMTLWQSRLFLADAEDPNLIWFSKQVIETTPVEMSDVLTLFVAPTTGAQGSTGPITALFAMDDKLLVFKKDAIYYITGSGPDNTGANNSFSDPVFVASTVGCTNPQSLVMTPGGVMFQSDKGIWILGRDLSTTYIGDRVESYVNANTVTGALCAPGTNQVRFTLDNRTAVMYDYYFNRWSNWSNVAAISSTIFQGLQVFIDIYGEIVQETAGIYLDRSIPVLLGLTTGWINLAGLQGYERFYFANLLGTYYTPFTLNVSMAYDYNPGLLQSTVVTPNNFAPNWGGEAQWGSGGSWGGPGNVFSARIFPEKQKCQSFQISIQENYDPSLGVAAGQGLSLSGLLLTAGIKRGSRTQSAAKSFG